MAKKENSHVHPATTEDYGIFAPLMACFISYFLRINNTKNHGAEKVRRTVRFYYIFYTFLSIFVGFHDMETVNFSL